MFPRKYNKQSKLKRFILKIFNLYAIEKETLNLVNPNYQNQGSNHFELNEKSIILSNGFLDLKRKIDNLDIYFRFAPNNALWNSTERWKRIVPNIDKKILIKVCLCSLKESILNFVSKKNLNVTINLITEFENQDEKFNNELLQLLKCDQINSKLIYSKVSGNRGTYLECCDQAENAQDIIFFVEDDYLFELNSIEEMIISFSRFSSLIKKDIFLCPSDYPFYYDSTYNTFLLFGKDYRWRKVEETLLTIMFSKELFQIFKKQIRQVGEKNNDPFEKPLHEIFKTNYCFAPISSLSYHISRGVPAINEKWLDLWKKYYKDLYGGP